MGTNFYAERLTCECCERPYGRLHIGKSSSGLHGYNERYPMTGDHGLRAEVVTVAQWRELLSQLEESGWVLRDEYGRATSVPLVLGSIVRNDRQLKANVSYWDGRYHGPLNEFTWTDEGYTFSTGEWS